MSTARISIMDAYAVKIINLFLHFFDPVDFLNLLFKFFNLFFHQFYLGTQLHIVAFEGTEDFFILVFELILERMKRFYSQIFVVF